MITARKPVSILVVLALVLSFGMVAVPQGTTEASTPVCTCGDICVNETGWWRNGSAFNASATPIQDAVDNATGGDTICVKDGNYHENVDVNTANLTIKSENGYANCVVSAASSNDHVFNVTTDWVNITGFTVQGATGIELGFAGIYLANATSHCNISSNKATNNRYGIYLYLSSNNTLTNNTVSNNTVHGIHLYLSGNNNLTSNIALNNSDGIWLHNSNNTILSGNTASNNDFEGIYVGGGSNYTLTNNTANLNSGSGIWVESSNNSTLIDNAVSSNGDNGIIIGYNSDHNKLVNNTATGHTSLGSFDVFILNSGDWEQQGETNFYDYETRQLALNHAAGNLDLRLSQHGHDAAYVDYVALMKDDTIYLPASAINIDNGVDILDKVISPEYDVCNAWNSTLEITWTDVPANTTLVMRAMEQDLGEGHGSPLYYPLLREGYTLSHTVIDDGGIAVDGYLEESGEPDFSVFWKPDSPHPDGYTDGWLHADNQYLYAAVEVTADNTPDDEDWGAIYVMVNGELQEFRVSSAETEWGVSGFQYTSSVPYEHRIYEFAVPLSEINASIGDKIGYGFGAYGTVATYYAGIILDSSSNNTLRENTLSNNEYGIYLRSSSNNNTLRDNTANSNDNSGICLYLSGNNNLTNNTASNNSNGIDLHNSNNTILSGNTASNNDREGISVGGGSNYTLTNNTANLNGGSGIWVDSSNNNTLIDNAVSSNGANGIIIGYNSDYNKLVNNTATGHSSGSFDVFILNSGNWEQQGETNFYDYETRQLALNHAAGNLDLRLSQHGHDAAYVDYVALMKDDTIYLPASAINIDNGVDILDKVISPEYDVCNAWNSTLEISWSDVPANTTLVMRAMEQDLGEGHGSPLYYPLLREGYTLSHTVIDDGGIAVDGYLEESGEPDFSVFWKPDSPHPDGYTYGWLHADNQYLYAAVEVTADNTPDDEDWGAIYVMVNGELQEFRVSSAETEWGVSGFQYTSSVPYEHRIYEFAVPLSEINASIGDSIGYGFGAYGTVAVFYCGIALQNSGNNTLSDNTLRNNDNGVYLLSSNNNTIYNNYFNNTNNAWDNGANTWNTTNTTGPNIVWGPYIGGNYWSDYTGNDTNGDGFGDEGLPYNCGGNIQNGGDYLPLIMTAATLEGHVTFPAARAGDKAEPFMVKLFEAGNLSNVLWTGNATTNSAGVFNITGLDPDTYDIGIKNATCVSELESGKVLTACDTSVVNFTIREGDVHSDDYVDMADYSDFSYAFMTLPSDVKWNANADLDRSGYIDMSDYSMFSYYFNELGDAYGHF